MTYRLISDEPSLSEAASQIAGYTRIALDCEAAGFHRYTDALCLVQLTTPAGTLLIDPLAVDPAQALRPILENPEVEVVMHGADFDLRLLDRDLDIQVQGLFDTQAAATLLGAEGIGLASVLEQHLGVQLSKAHQRADWGKRPLPRELLEYAADDTRHLLRLRDLLWEALVEKGREEWAREEFRFLEAIRWEEDETDPVTRLKGAQHWPVRKVAGVRAALDWRDRIAQTRDRAPFRVVSDSTLEEVVEKRPNNVEELASLKGMSPRLARSKGQELLDELDRIDGLGEEDLVPYPRPARNGPGRPSPEEEAKADAIRQLRTDRARELGLDRGVLLSNAQIGEVVRAAPADVEELRAVDGIKGWQAQILGPEVIRILHG